ncbi:PPOX class F420-dependent oxidoreductase [Kitasatospora sp. GP82]|uniref:PPOX class F420-dependent oxidoreductase n=1 Tax=Kitasatospora sp. GP82 TaxID=3035089 RepID=UPI00247345AE|nr:PPOX class F420-dependent oxidoreductase [Kitasatospora sp. GP82]MDH6128320.1 PPOX class probable F420-dependent enzyme [Kitasatospora sp. GP82]
MTTTAIHEESAAQRLADQLAANRHLLLTTADGTPLTDATWVVPDGAALGIWVPADGRAARQVLRRSRVFVVPCDGHGRPAGRRVPARAAVCDPDTTARYRTALINKYGFPALLRLARSRLRRGLDGTVGIRITLIDRERLLTAEAWHPSGWYSLN